MAVDGSLNFDTGVNTDGFEDGIDDVQEIADRLSKSMKNLGKELDDAFSGKATKVQNLTNKIQLTEDKIKQLASEMDALSNTEYHSKEFDQMTTKINKANDALDTLYDKRGELENSLRKGIEEVGLPYTEENLTKLVEENKEWGKLSSKINEAEKQLSEYEAKLKGISLSDSDYNAANTDKYKKKQLQLDALLTQYQKYRTELNNVNRSEQKNTSETKKSEKSTNKKVSTVNKANNTTKRYNKTLAMLGKSLMFSMVFRAFNAAMNGIKEGMQNLAKYSTDTNKTLSAFSTSSLQLKNSLATAFSPILTAVAPALTTLINLLSTAITVMGQFFAVLFNGATAFTRAKKAQVDYAKSLKNTAKEANKTLSPIDKLNNISDSGGGANAGTPDVKDMFEEVEISPKFMESVEMFKSIIADIFKPFKESWDKYGVGTTQSAKEAFTSILSTIGSIGNSLLTVWGNGTGTQTIDNILITFTNISETIKNISDNFRTAWEMDGTGTQIIQDIFNSLNNVLGLIRDISIATNEWSLGLDFTPILESFQNLTSSLEPLTGNIADALLWLYENILLPFGKWTIEDVMPLFFEGLAAVFTILNNTIEALKPLGLWLWENLLEPIAEWTGGIIVDVLGWIVDKLKDFGNWIEENQGTVETIAIIIGSFAAALGLVNVAIGIWNVIGVVATGVTAAFSAAVAFLTSPIGLVVIAIGALIAIVVLLVKNWDKVKEAGKNAWKEIQNGWNAAGNWFNTKIIEPISKGFTGLWTGLKAGAKLALSNIKDGFKTTFISLVDLVKKPVNLIIDVLNGMVNGVTSGINSVIRAINSINFTLPDWIPGIGGKGIGFNIKEFNSPKIPKLATGTVVPSNYGEFLAILGDNKREAEVVSPLSTIKQALIEALAESGGGGITEVHIHQHINGKEIHEEVVRVENNKISDTGQSSFAIPAV